MQLVSDVPVGVFLSGGIDSSTTAAIATRVLERRLPSFTMGFDDEGSDERAYARATSQFLGTLAHEEVLTQERRARPDPRLRRAPRRALLRPLEPADARGLAARAPLRRPGDPLGRRRGRALRRLPLVRGRAGRGGRPAGGGSAKRLRGAGADLLAAHLARVSPLGRGAAVGAPASTPAASIRCGCLRRFDRAAAPRVTRLQLADLQTFLVDDVLLKVDHASMACGVEVRVPFLDHELVEAGVLDRQPRALRRGASARRCSSAPPRAGSRRRSSPSRKKGFSVAARRLDPAQGLARAAPRRCCPTACWSRAGCCDGRGGARRCSRRSAARTLWLLFAAELWARHWLEPAGPSLREWFPARWRARREGPLPLARQPALEVGAHLPGDEDGRGARRRRSSDSSS